MAKVQAVDAWEILDSRGNPTVRATVVLRNGCTGTASVPSGASTGSHEALELRDGDKKRYGGLGVRKAVRHIATRIAPQLRGMDASRLQQIDQCMIDLDGTPNKSRIGANAILAVSLAVARAAAADAGKPLYQWLRSAYRCSVDGFRMPRPMMNIVNGGCHADSGMTIQEFMILPKRSTVAERIRVGAEVFQALKRVLRDRGDATTVGDEGGFAPRLESNDAALDVIMDAIREAHFIPGKDVELALDVAASEFYRKGSYYFADRFGTTKHPWTADQLSKQLEVWLEKYPIVSIEDPLAEDDWKSWKTITERLGKRIRIVGDDLFVTNVERLQRGIDMHVANAILIKVNQIGSVSETMRAIALAQEHAYDVVISHRSGETADTFIADLAVAVGAPFIKTGSLSRSERVEKYNRLMEIERQVRP